MSKLKKPLTHYVLKRLHHSMETLCIRHIHFEALEKMTPSIMELMKANLGTKIACAHFVCLVSCWDKHNVKDCFHVCWSIFRDEHLFQGKERLLQALSSLCKYLKKDESSNYTLNEDRFEEIYNIIWYLIDKNEETIQEKYQMLFVEQCVRCLKNNTRPVLLSVLILSAVVYIAGIPLTGLKKEVLDILLILVKRLVHIKSKTELSMVKKTSEDILVTLQKGSAPVIKCH